MKILVTGGSGLLGSALRFLEIEHEVSFPPRKLREYTMYVNLDGEPSKIWALNLSSPTPEEVKNFKIAFLCAGTKGTQECEGNREVFLADVDGNIRLARHLLKQGTFVVFVSTDAVETSLNTAYARNRFLVEQALGGLPNTAIFRPGRFDKLNVDKAARALATIGLQRLEGLHRWP